MTRLTVILGAIFALLVLTSLLIKKSVRAEIVIAATPEAVWATITNPATYVEWNPIFVAYKGTFGQGNSLSLQMKMDGTDPVERRCEGQKFCSRRMASSVWRLSTFLTYDHNWCLKALVNEYYTGLPAFFWDPSPAQVAYP